MKNRIILQLLSVLIVILILSFTSPAQTTEFTYQGNLTDNSQPANGSYDFEFALFDAMSAGNQLGSTITVNGVAVSDGDFTVKLDFGGEFPGAGRWLDIRVQQSTGAANKERLAVFTTLTPRQPVTSTPYAVKSLNAANAETATNATQLGGINAGQFVLTSDPRLTDPRPPTTGSTDYIQNTTTPQTSSNFNISGTGDANNFNAATQYNIGGNRVLSVAGPNNFFAGSGAGQSNTTGDYNSFFGESAGLLNTTGHRNSFFGFGAGRDNTTGSYNSFFGKDAGILNTTGSSNSFFGKGSGQSNTTGANNSFFGESAGRDNTSGYQNSFFGFQTGKSNVNSGSNSFFGYKAGLENLNGENNSFFGSDAGTNNTFGSENSFFGASAGFNNTGGLGLRNSFFGAFSGRDNTGGNENSFFGRMTGLYNTTGSSNSFFGETAGYSNLTGNENSFFGKEAGMLNGGAGTGGNENTFLGAFAGKLNATGSNNTIIGHSANVGAGDLTYSTAVGSSAIVSTSNTVQLGRNGADTVRIGKLGAAGATSLCQNTSKEISTCSSSIRYKSNIEDFRPGLDLIEKIRPVSFNWKRGGMPDVGLVAEEVEKIEPLLTTRNQDGQIEGVKYDRLGVVLVNAVKEQQKQLEELKETNKRYVERLAKQQQKLEQQEAEIKGLKALVCSQNKEANICQ